MSPDLINNWTSPHFFLLLPNTVKPVLSDHIRKDIFLAFQTGGCLLLPESIAESSFLHYFHSALSNHLSIAISMSTE